MQSYTHDRLLGDCPCNCICDPGAVRDVVRQVKAGGHIQDASFPYTQGEPWHHSVAPTYVPVQTGSAARQLPFAAVVHQLSCFVKDNQCRDVQLCR